ncbi:MAG: hypothetical protein U5R31_11180 [Acidimicrobiia bacterium]|nr:hypothetical protein [Acidimicrobiia bacterium]
MGTKADDDVARCGYPTKDGSPCRIRVSEAGKVCRVHQKAALLDRILTGEIPRGDPGDSSDADSS